MWKSVVKSLETQCTHCFPTPDYARYEIFVSSPIQTIMIKVQFNHVFGSIPRFLRSRDDKMWKSVVKILETRFAHSFPTPVSSRRRARLYQASSHDAIARSCRRQSRTQRANCARAVLALSQKYSKSVLALARFEIFLFYTFLVRGAPTTARQLPKTRCC